jgi:two-component SAPR family response regulator
MEHNFLVITDDENSKLIKTLLKLRVVPVIRRSISSAIQILRHLKIQGIIVEDEHKSLDTLEFILNVRDISEEIPIFISNRYQKHTTINQLKKFSQIEIFDETDNKIEKKLRRIVSQ